MIRMADSRPIRLQFDPSKGGLPETWSRPFRDEHKGEPSWSLAVVDVIARGGPSLAEKICCASIDDLTGALEEPRCRKAISYRARRRDPERTVLDESSYALQ